MCNAEKFKYFERWASANAFPRANIINNGATSATGNLGALADFSLAVRSKQVREKAVMCVVVWPLVSPLFGRVTHE